MAPVPGGPQTILLVEDNDDHAELILRSLQSVASLHRVIRVVDGQDALDYLHREGKYRDPVGNPFPTVIFLDLRLPRVDGLDVLKTIKSDMRLFHIPVVVLTSSDANDDIVRSYQYHANSYIVKPFDFGNFMKMMGDLGFYWLKCNTSPLFS
ncbi:MAG TPA: response regulator [Methanomicrobiales archaeon]|nr:response regulator [Methanomicrobiales archaeon]